MPRVPKKQLPPLNLSNESIGERLARFRKERGLTQVELSEKIGIERTVLADYERNRIRLYDEMVSRFSIALGVTSDEILALSDNKSRISPPSLKLVRRMKKIENLPEGKQKALLQIIDGYVKAEGMD